MLYGASLNNKALNDANDNSLSQKTPAESRHNDFTKSELHSLNKKVEKITLKTLTGDSLSSNCILKIKLKFALLLTILMGNKWPHKGAACAVVRVPDSPGPRPTAWVTASHLSQNMKRSDQMISQGSPFQFQNSRTSHLFSLAFSHLSTLNLLFQMYSQWLCDAFSSRSSPI